MSDGSVRVGRSRVLGAVLLSMAIAPAAVALLALGLSAYATWENAAFTSRSLEARGRVVQIVRRATGRTNAPRHRDLPIVEFTTAEGHHGNFTSEFRGDPPFKVGDEVAVLYPPERPSQARLAAAWSTWGSEMRNWAVFGGGLLLALSAALALAGWMVLRRP